LQEPELGLSDYLCTAYQDGVDYAELIPKIWYYPTVLKQVFLVPAIIALISGGNFMRGIMLLLAIFFTLGFLGCVYAQTVPPLAPPPPPAKAAAVKDQEEAWPVRVDTFIAFASRRNARLQLAAEGRGRLSHGLSLRVGGWLLSGTGSGVRGTRGYLGNAYVGMNRSKYYLAAGQKFVVFGPAGLMISPGMRGGEAVLKGQPITLQLLGGRTQFSPLAGTADRTTPNNDPVFGSKRPRRDFTAMRAEYDFPRGDHHSYAGLSSLWMDSKTGVSVDVETPFTNDRTFYAEVSSFNSVNAEVAGVRFNQFRRYLHTDRETVLNVYWINVEDNYLPAEYGATQYYPSSTGLGVYLSHRLGQNSSLGLSGDSRGVTLGVARSFILD
jgi:hypothetical protein